MGVCMSVPPSYDYVITVKTGDVRGSCSDCNVFCALIDEHGARSRDIQLGSLLYDDFENGALDKFDVTNAPNLGEIHCIELWRDTDGLFDDWFVQYVIVTPVLTATEGQKSFTFPVNRWLPETGRFKVSLYDSSLPQFDEHIEQRKVELEQKRADYVFSDWVLSGKTGGLPRRAKTLPQEQTFSLDYKLDLVARRLELIATAGLVGVFKNDKWERLEDMQDIYGHGLLYLPKGYRNWQSDTEFGKQRLLGTNPTRVRRCHNIPENFAVTSEMLEPFLDGKSLEDVIADQRIYIVNHDILDGITTAADKKVCAPIALFHAKIDGEFKPLAIQLFQTPADNNPVFLPSDPKYTWLLAKMFFNNADCCIHQSATHLGNTHLIMESIALASYRELSPSHPVFQLIAPHFLFLMAVNSRGLDLLLAEGGWFDQIMQCGLSGTVQIMRKNWSTWRMDREGWLPEDLTDREVDDVTLLPAYLFRDDALLVHGAIERYVRKVIGYVYDTSGKLENDYEIQNWAKALVSEDGARIQGVFGDGSFSNVSDLVKTVTAIIYMGSVAHTYANFAQYDESGFPPNYPLMLDQNVPTTKDELTEQELISHLPTKEQTLDIMTVTRLLSERSTQRLGNFEVQYLFAPSAVEAADQFRSELAGISKQIQARANTESDPYLCLDPAEIPNAISI